MRRITFLSLLFLGLAFGIETGCTFRGTTQEIFDTTSNITVSTSGRIWWNEDGMLKSEYKALAFALYNQPNLEQDLARSHGEYLASMASLLGVDENDRPTVAAVAQSRLGSLAPGHGAIQLQRLFPLAD